MFFILGSSWQIDILPLPGKIHYTSPWKNLSDAYAYPRIRVYTFNISWNKLLD